MLNGPKVEMSLREGSAAAWVCSFGVDGHVVLDAEHLEVLDAQGDVGRAGVGQTDHGVGGLQRQLGLVDEMERCRGRGLVVEALHGTDAAVGPVRQDGQRIGGPVVVHRGVVLPHDAAAAVRFGRLYQLGDDLLVLRPTGLVHRRVAVCQAWPGRSTGSRCSSS